MNNVTIKILFVIIVCLSCITIPVPAAITTNAATVNATCIQMSGSNSGAAESVYFDYGHSSNAGFSSSTENQTAAGTFTELRCDEPTFLPGYQYKYRACGVTSGCGSNVSFTMNAVIPHITTNFSVQGEAFIQNAGSPSWLAQHIWDVYTVAWGAYFFLLLIAFVMMNITIKQKSVTISFLLMLISGGMLWSFAPMEMQHLAIMLMAVAMAGLMFWLYKRRR